MIYTNNIKKAMNLAYKFHNNQFDKGGMPYIFHPIHLAEKMNSEDTIIVALLHDLVEDTSIDFSGIKEIGFNNNIIDSLKLLTKNNNIEYNEYIKGIKNNEIARAVKIEDLKHNLDNSRLDIIDEKTIERNNKYKKSLEFLLN